MDKKKKIDKVFLEQPFRSKKKFIAGKISVAVALLTLVTTFALTIFYWNSLAWYVQLIAGFIVLSLSPSAGDFKFLIMSYDTYKDEWQKHNDRH